VDKIMVLKDGSVAMFGERMEVLKALSGNRGPQTNQSPQIEG
jgi:ATP-binding cassette subfamily C protein